MPTRVTKTDRQMREYCRRQEKLSGYLNELERYEKKNRKNVTMYDIGYMEFLNRKIGRIRHHLGYRA